jgi:hypothetical protein
LGERQTEDLKVSGSIPDRGIVLGKNLKYQPLSRYLANLGKAVFNIALVYGSLGSVAVKNLELLTQVLDLPKAIAHKLQVKISAMNIKASRRIWMHHCAACHTQPPGGMPVIGIG